MSQPSPTPNRILGLSETGIIWLCYVLHGLALFCGGLTWLPAIIINYIKRNDAQRVEPASPETTLMLSHMRWQISTFWWALGLSLAAALFTMLLAITVVGAMLIYPLWLVLLVWYVYRLIKGLLALNSGRTVE